MVVPLAVTAEVTLAETVRDFEGVIDGERDEEDVAEGVFDDDDVSLLVREGDAVTDLEALAEEVGSTRLPAGQMTFGGQGVHQVAGPLQAPLVWSHVRVAAP